MQLHISFTVISDFTGKGLILFVFIKANSSVAAQTIQPGEVNERSNMFGIKMMLNLERHPFFICSYPAASAVLLKSFL